MTLSEPIRASARVVLRTSAVFAVLGAIACSDMLSPGKISGLYVLELYDGAALPGDCSSGPEVTGFATRCTILADTIRIHDNGTATFGRELRSVTELRPDGDVTHTTSFSHQTFDYAIDKDVIHLVGRPPVLPAHNLAPAPGRTPVPESPSLLSYVIQEFDARLSGNILTVHDRLAPGPVRTYRRVDSGS